MSKSVLVIDTPESCRNCRVKYDSYGECDICAGKDLIVDNYVETNTKPDWCPLSPLPDRKDLKQYVDNTACDISSVLAYQYAQGWNSFREELLKGKE